MYDSKGSVNKNKFDDNSIKNGNLGMDGWGFSKED